MQVKEIEIRENVKVKTQFIMFFYTRIYKYIFSETYNLMSIKMTVSIKNIFCL